MEILGVPFDIITIDEAYRILVDFINKGQRSSSFNRQNEEDNPKQSRAKFVITANTEIVMAAQEDRELQEIIKKAHLVVADGIGVVWASKYFGEKIPERVAGFDLMNLILKKAPERGHRVFLLGGKPGVPEAASDRIANLYPGIQIVGCHHGYFSHEEEDKIIRNINQGKPHFLFVAMGAPRQEKWIFRNLSRIDTGVCMGVGGSLDIFAGKTKRAPEIFQRTGLEWFYRLMREPYRIGRMMSLPRFVLKVMAKRYLGKGHRKAAE